MKSYSIKFKEENMLCHKCLETVVKSLSGLDNIEEINVSLETQKIKLKYNNKTLTKEDIRNIVEQSILTGKVIKLNN